MRRSHDTAYNRDEDHKPTQPRMAQEPADAAGSARSAKTRTDPASGEHQRGAHAPDRAKTDQTEGVGRDKRR